MYGRLTGLSGYFNTTIKRNAKEGFEWKTMFLVGLITMPVLLNQIFGSKITLSKLSLKLFDTNEEVAMTVSN